MAPSPNWVYCPDCETQHPENYLCEECEDRRERKRWEEEENETTIFEEIEIDVRKL